MEFKIITAKTPGGLNSKINDYIGHGWKVVGSHQVVNTHLPNAITTLNQLEYSICVTKEETTPEVL